ncbi:MAG: 23S rRNA (uracil(1939)-C(5))-methyltransferase RlmD [Chloroflexi bacterium]|jgi:23S rRNA (uracil1939-C5)-methyltransferase|nr:23S rRNA (uracil(1939)-C(5))-methyltransferase RlmD [Chloroflexota bacterium]MBT3994511.1 23S rRNA (uracil(1939)-C(5))-methyltransferase RlmD [Chloroflexota bacterium]
MAKRKRRQRYNGPDLTAHIDLNPGDNFKITLGAINDAGDTVAEIDGAPIIVSGGLPGEVVIAEVQKKFPERIAAIVAQVIEPAAERIEPECKYFLACSGCQWQHVSYGHQLQLKRERVQREIANYANLSDVEVDRTVESEKRLKYRNHGRFTIGKYEDSGEVGYKNAVTRQFVRIEECLLMDEKVNDTIALVQDKMEGQTQMSIRVGVNTDSMLVQPKMDIPGLDLVTGVQHYEEEVRGSRFTVAASSFFQVNTGQLSRAVDEVRELLELGGDEVMVDAYCGVGVFAVLMSPYVQRVVGIEESASAIEDANQNLNGVTNVEFIEGKTEHVMADWQDEDSVDVLLLDPPRVGCHPDVLESVKKLQPKKVLMISCEPAAMARDLDLLCDGGMYKLDTVRPVDMFPQTRHVETISVLSFQGIQG